MTLFVRILYFEILEEIDGLIYNNQPLQNDTLYNELNYYSCYGFTWYLYSNENNNIGLEGTDGS